MTLGILFWVVYVIIVIVGTWAVYTPDNRRPAWAYFGILLLTFLLGWGTFGPIVHK